MNEKWLSKDLTQELIGVAMESVVIKKDLKK